MLPDDHTRVFKRQSRKEPTRFASRRAASKSGTLIHPLIFVLWLEIWGSKEREPEVPSRIDRMVKYMVLCVDRHSSQLLHQFRQHEDAARVFGSPRVLIPGLSKEYVL